MKESRKANGMVDVSQKEKTRRIAVASAEIKMTKGTLATILKNGSPKGNVLETARVAGVMAAKATPSIIPLCHPIELNKVSVDFKIIKPQNKIKVISEVICFERTGAEMEALTAASAAALTVYDMMKWMDKGMVISDIKLLYKSGGKSGIFKR